MSCGSGPGITSTHQHDQDENQYKNSGRCPASDATRSEARTHACAALAYAHARIEYAIKDVGHNVGNHHGHCRKQEDALQHGIVAIANRGDEQTTEPGPGEHGLHQNGPRQRVAKIVADDRHHRDQAIGQHMAPKHRAPAQSLSPCRQDIVLGERLQHACSCYPRHDGNVENGDAEGRQHQVPEDVPDRRPARRGVAQADHSLRRQPFELDGEEDDQQLAQPENRYRISDEAESRDGAVVDAASARRRRQGQEDPQHCRERERGEHQEQRQASTIKDEAQYRLTVGEGKAQIALRQVPQVQA